MVDQKALGLLVAGLVVGLLGGYLATSTQLTGLRSQMGENMIQFSLEIDALEGSLSEKEDEYAALSDEYSDLSEDHTALSEHMEGFDDELITLQNDVESITFSFNQLQDSYLKLEEEHEALLLDYQDIIDLYQESEDELAQLNEDYSNLEILYNQLNSEYEELSLAHEAIINPVSTYASINEFDIDFSLDQTVFNYRDSVSGSVSVFYIDGTPFDGYVWIGMRNMGGGSALKKIHVVGNSTFTLNAPVFRDGPWDGYKIGLWGIEDSEGYTLVRYEELEDEMDTPVVVN